MKHDPTVLPVHRLISGLTLLVLAGLSVAAERLPSKTYSVADGLPHNLVKRVIPDSRGFLWFITSGGLSRFDGRHFVNYGPADGLTFNNPNHLIETRSGVYWVATNGGGVYRFHPEAGAARRFTPYRVGGTPAASRVNLLLEDRAGSLWAGTDGGLFRLDEKAGAFLPVALEMAGLDDRLIQVWSLAEDRQGKLWIATKFGLSARRPDGRMLHYAVQPTASEDVIFALLLDRGGRLWVGHKTAGALVFAPETLDCGWRILDCGLQKQDGRRAPNATIRNLQSTIRNYTMADGLGSNDVRSFCEMPDGRLWLGTNGGGIAEFDGQRWQSYNRVYDLQNEIAGWLSTDRAGGVWISTNGVTRRLARDGFVNYREADGLGHRQIISAFTDNTGTLYAISGNWRVNRFERGQLDGGRFTSVRLNLPLLDTDWRAVRNILRTQDGEWWAPTAKGLFRFAAVTQLEQLATARPRALYTVRDGLLSDDVTYLYEDARGDLWMSAFAPGQEVLARWERATGRFYRYGVADGLPPFNAVVAYAEDTAGALWFGFREGGLARYAGGRFKLLTAAEGAPTGGIQGLVRDAAGRLWLGSVGGGLSRVDDPTAAQPHFVTVTPRDGLSSQYTAPLTTDGAGRVYCATERGLDRFDPATGRFRTFTIADGLSSGMIYRGWRDQQGWLWFGTAQGFARMIPTPDPPVSPPPVFISDVRVEGEARSLFALGQQSVSGLTLEPQQNYLEIAFFGFALRGSEVLRYQTKLEGLPGDWSAPVSQNSVNLRLSPGTYRLLVRAVSADGTPSETPATVSFTILRPLWQRWWFIGLWALALTCAGYAFYRYRLQRLLEVERVRMRIATELHDDIGTSLSRIALLSEVVKQQTGSLNLRTAQLLNDISDSARELLDSMSDIVWSIDPRRDDVEHVVARIRQFAADVLGARRIAWELQVAPAIEQLKLQPEPRHQLYLIFKEAINNIAKHARCHAVALELSAVERQLRAVIHDDGCGFVVPAPSELSSNGYGGHGLGSMRTRVEQMGGEFSLESVPGHGTRITFQIPLHKVTT